MLLSEGNNAVVTFYKIGCHVVTVVVPVGLLGTEQEVGAEMGQNGADGGVFSKEEDGRQGKPFLATFKVF